MSGRLIFLFGIFSIFIIGFFAPLSPIPADNIQGLYYPFKDLPTSFPNGVPYKNSLITDPIRQQFPWKLEAVQQIKSSEFPLWNPYNFAGTPLLANIQSGIFYPANIIFLLPFFDQSNFLLSFAKLWGSYIYLQSLLAFTFFYLYVRNLGMSRISSIFGSVSWTFCGFLTTWWEWGNIGHTILWFPLVLWSIEKFIADPLTHTRRWFQLPHSLFILLFALISSFFAGHWQSFSFIVINTMFYLTYRLPPVTLKIAIKTKPKINLTRRRFVQWIQLSIIGTLFLFIVSPQLLPSLEFINRSARDIDPIQWQRPDWFFPYQHLITFLAPDFFGNPSTQNYWGIWNYGEFTAYSGLLPFIFALAMIIHWFQQQYANLRQKNNSLDITESNSGVGFFLFCALINLFLITRNPITEAPYQYALPFLSTTQPSRGIVMVQFSIAILATAGMHYFLKNRIKLSKTNPLFISISSTIAFFVFLAIAIFQKLPLFHTTELPWWQIAASNLRLPLTLLIFSICLVLAYYLFQFQEKVRIQKLILKGVIISLILISTLDLGRFFFKFNSFTPWSQIYPATPITQKELLPDGHFMVDDDRLIAPNINSVYKLPTVNGYDPLYSKNYGQLIGIWVRDQPDLTPFPANRILVPHQVHSRIADIAGVTSFYSFTDYSQHPEFTKLSQYGQTSLYQRNEALAPFTLIPDVSVALTDQSTVDQLFDHDFLPKQRVILTVPSEITSLTSLSTSAQLSQQSNYSITDTGQIQLISSSASHLELSVRNDLPQGAVLYRTTAYDPNWQATINQQPTDLYRANLAFQAIIIPSGTHRVTFTYFPQSFHYGIYLGILGTCVTLVLTLFRAKRLGKYV